MGENRLYHLGFGPSDLTDERPQTALLCGDPRRAQRIARATEGVRLVRMLSENRGLDSYLCQLSTGQTFLSATSGMGAPSLSIVVTELFRLGVRTIIRVGSCGSIQERVLPGSVVIASSAVCRQGAALDLAPPGFPAAADPFLTVALARAARELDLDWHLGCVASMDTFYEGQERLEGSPHLLRSLVGRTAEYRALNVLAYEMEAGTLFTMGGIYGFSTGCVCAVLAARSHSEEIVPAVKERAEWGAIRVALDALTGFIATPARP